VNSLVLRRFSDNVLSQSAGFSGFPARLPDALLSYPSHALTTFTDALLNTRRRNSPATEATAPATTFFHSEHQPRRALRVGMQQKGEVAV
jgi:hypothetical protein